MISIYFNDTLINSDNYMAFNYSYKMFEKNFILGTTSAIPAEMKCPKSALIENLEKVVVKIDNVEFLTLYVDEITVDDDNIATIKLLDKLLYTQVEYDFSSLVPLTSKELLEAICLEFNIPHDTFSFTNDDVVISSYDNTIQAREYIGMIAELAGCYAIIDSNGKLVLRKHEIDAAKIITVDDIDSYKLGDIIEIQRVVYDNGTGTLFQTSTDDTLYTIYLSTDNLFLQLIDETQFLALANNILGFKFANIKIPNCNVFFEPGSGITFIDANSNEIPMLSEFNCSYFGVFTGSYETSVNNEKQEVSKVIPNEEKIKRLKTTINQVSNQLTITASQVGDNSSSIAQLFINDQEINQQVASNTSDIDALDSSLSQLIQSSNEVGIILQNNSGNNLLTNTQFYLNAETWTIENNADYEILENTEIRNLSLSDRALYLQTGLFRQKFATTIGQQYTLAFTNKQTANSNFKVLLYRNGYIVGSTDYVTIYDSSLIADWNNVSYSWIATVNTNEIVIISTNAYATVFDLVVQLGVNTKWSPNYGEARGANYKFVIDGLYIYDTNNLNNYVKIYNNLLTYYVNGVEKGSYGPESMSVNSVIANEQLQVAGLIVKKISSSPNIYGFY